MDKYPNKPSRDNNDNTYKDPEDKKGFYNNNKLVYYYPRNKLYN